jgi:hypothetical protein
VNLEKVMRTLGNNLRPFVEGEVYGLPKAAKVLVEPETPPKPILLATVWFFADGR